MENTQDLLSQLTPTTTQEVYDNLQQNILIPFHTIHDEIDTIMSAHLLPAISKRITEIGAVKKVFDKIGTGYIDYKFDVEYSSKNSFIPDSSLPAYTQPSSETEYIHRKEFLASEKQLDNHTPHTKIKLPEHLSIKDIRPYIDYQTAYKNPTTLIVEYTKNNTQKEQQAKALVNTESIMQLKEQYPEIEIVTNQ